jgi:Zn-dependent protease with chaperone function
MRGLAAAAALAALPLAAQTRITPPDNKYAIEEDVKLGREAAQQARGQYPLMGDEVVSRYVETLGKRLVAAIPAPLQHTEFAYTFETVNVRDINAFALPGGPMFVNRGMIEAAHAEGEVAGVMAHEISHVVLRHGTAQASKASKFQIGAVAGAVLGAVLGGRVGNVVAEGARFGLGAAFMRYGREYEKQADLQGAQIMADAGYDPRDMANMFKTIEKQGGANGPEWLSDHPNPGNRSDYITQEAASLRVVNPRTDAGDFTRVSDHLKSLPPAPTSAEAAKARKGPATSREPDRAPSGRVDPPSSRFVEYVDAQLARLSVPSNWVTRRNGDTVTFTPEGGSGVYKGQPVFSHGVELGTTAAQAADLPRATDAFVAGLSQANPRLQRTGLPRNTSLDGRPAVSTTFDNVSDATGRQESIGLVTARLGENLLFYLIAVAPREEFNRYDPVFEQITTSIRFLRD